MRKWERKTVLVCVGRRARVYFLLLSPASISLVRRQKNCTQRTNALVHSSDTQAMHVCAVVCLAIYLPAIHTHTDRHIRYCFHFVFAETCRWLNSIDTKCMWQAVTPACACCFHPVRREERERKITRNRNGETERKEGRENDWIVLQAMRRQVIECLCTWIFVCLFTLPPFQFLPRKKLDQNDRKLTTFRQHWKLSIENSQEFEI